MNDRQFEETADAAPAAETAVGDEETAAVAAVAPTPEQRRIAVRLVKAAEAGWPHDRDALIDTIAEFLAERDEAQEAGRRCVAENAALRRERDALRAALDFTKKEIAGVLREAQRHVENAPEGPPERGNGAEAVEEPETASGPLAPL